MVLSQLWSVSSEWLGQNAGPFQDKDVLELVEDADVLGLGLSAGKRRFFGWEKHGETHGENHLVVKECNKPPIWEWFTLW